MRLFQCPILPLSSSQSPSQSFNVTRTCHPNIHPAICLLESQKAFYIVQTYIPYTLWDLVVFSPAMVEGSHAKMLFILYQILQAVRSCHSKGLSVGDLKLNDCFVDSKLWIMLTQPQITRICSLDSRPQQQGGETVNSGFDSNKDLCEQQHLPALVQKWIYGELSNFDYLMALNLMAGRKIGDPNHHPILPWIIDFTSENGGYRNLTMSKYRLNKGDAQLDLTYDISSPFMTDTDRHGDPLQIPHHVSDMLSDITYFVYKARRIPKTVLCTHVRSKWVPHEYPSSMERMQQWTPDECIPEFFTDPEIFKSIHDDLDDLEVPSWCSDAEDFVHKHMSILEGEYVSQRLHHWIDLTFGYKVSSNR